MIDQPMMAIAPYCPKCGLMCAFSRRSRFVGDVVPVECPCGWIGAAPHLIPMPHLQTRELVPHTKRDPDAGQE